MRTADVKLFVRNLFRNKLYSGITVLGFAMALTFVVLLTVYIRQELSVDVFHAHKDRIVRLASEKGSGYSGPMAAMLKEQFPEVEDYCLFMTNKDGLAAVSPTEKIRYTYAYVSPSFFQMFSFPLVQGNPDEVTFGEDNGLTLANLKGETDLTNEKWTDLIDQITLEEAMIRTGFGGTSTKSIVSIVSPEAVQNDGPNGFNSYTLGQYANTDTDSADPYVIDPDDKNLNYKFGTMSNETVIAQTFSKEMAAEYGAVTGNYSIWSNLPILWGAGTNLHRTPYNARNHEYYSEDAILTAYQAAAYIAAGKEYGCIIAPKHFAFNDTEINRSGIATFMTEQKARENELRGTQASVEDAQTLGMMTTFNRIGCTAGNAHYGLLMNILRKEWGFQGLMSEDFIQDANYSVLKEAVHCGVTMTCNTGDSNMEAVTAKWNYWTTEAVSKDASMMQDLKNVMMWQNYALANSNAMDGLNETSQIKDVRTWYDNALTATSAVLALLTLAAAAMYIRDAKRRKNS